MATLLDYTAVDPAAKANLLLGNGFSRGLHECFKYGSLKQEAENAGLISDEVGKLFTTLGTDDFEKVLARLAEAQEVNRLLLPNVDCRALDRGYTATRDALFEAISLTHPERQMLDIPTLESHRLQLCSFNRIFTTNYDLLLYWIAALEAGGKGSFQGFCDFFWGEQGRFDSANTRHPPSRTGIYYLHGALFLSSQDGRTLKRRSGSSGQTLLEFLKDALKDNPPVFVSEGTSEAKRRSIAQNDYLEWVYGELEKLDEGITVFGHSLDDKDHHIVAALCRKGGRPLAISIYKDTVPEVIAEKARLVRSFAEYGRVDDLIFFDARTFPLASAMPRPS